MQDEPKKRAKLKLKPSKSNNHSKISTPLRPLVRKTIPRPTTRENSKISVKAQAAPAIKNTIQRILAHMKPAVTVVTYILILKSAQQKAKNVIHAKRLVIFQKFAGQAKNLISHSQRDIPSSQCRKHPKS